MKDFHCAAIKAVTPTDRVFRSRIESCRTSTIPASLKKCYETGRIDAFKLNWKEGMPNPPHIFFDSDVAKVLEGVANVLALHPDAELEKEYDRLIDLIVSAQQPDGYLNSYFSTVEKDQRWKNLCRNHELYCAGHLIEAAVAGYELLGKRKLLEAVCRYADYIGTVFGRGPGQKRGIPGHEEIELALIRLYEATKERKYLDLAKYFVDERGQKPNYFSEVEKNGLFNGPIYQQAHIPLREQKTAEGHAVRAVYLYCGAADVARCTGDEELLQACRGLLENIISKRSYVTGGIGSTFWGEAFTYDYDLPNGGVMYAESCAAIGLVRFTSRMLNATGEGRYADFLERVLFNAALPGISLSGDRFFYANYLEMSQSQQTYACAKERQPWFSCSCCPTNFCRFLPEMLQYIWSVGKSEVRLNIPVANRFRSPFGELEVQSEYPDDGRISLKVGGSGRFRLAIHLPEWAGSVAFTLNGSAAMPEIVDGYAVFDREWRAGDAIVYTLPMAVRVVRCNHRVPENIGKIALSRGPIIYALETVDNPDGVFNLAIPADQEFQVVPAAGLPEGVRAICGKAVSEQDTEPEQLYTTRKPVQKTIGFTAIPYALWQNRGPAEMTVWVREA